MDILSEVQNALNYYAQIAVNEKDVLYLSNIYSQLYYILNVENRALSDSEFDALLKALGINDTTELVQQYMSMNDEQKKELLLQILQMIDATMKNSYTMVNY